MTQLAPPPTDPEQPLSPQEVAQIRRHFAKYIVEAMPSIRKGLLGQEHWTTQRLGLFKTIAGKVIPDLSASFSQHHHTHDDLSKLSRAELERIASGLAVQSVLTITPEVLHELEQSKAEALATNPEVQPPPAGVLPDPRLVTEQPDPRLAWTPLHDPDSPAPDNGFSTRRYEVANLGRPRRTPEETEAKLKRSHLYAVYTDPTQLKLAFSRAHHYYAYPPGGGEPEWLGPNPKEWCEKNGFDRRAVARIAHGYPNMSRGTPYLQRSIRGWGFSCDLKGVFKAHAQRNEPVPGSILPNATKATHAKVKKRKLTPRMTKEERLQKIEDARKARAEMETRIAKAKADGIELSVRLKGRKEINREAQKPKEPQE